MSYSGLLTHRAVIKRRAAGTDRFGQPLNTFTQVASGVACRIRILSGGERWAERNVDIAVETSTMYVAAATDIKETDMVTVTDAGGTALLTDAQVLQVRTVTDGMGQPHHKEVELEVTRGATS